MEERRFHHKGKIVCDWGLSPEGSGCSIACSTDSLLSIISSKLNSTWEISSVTESGAIALEMSFSLKNNST